MDAVVHRIDVGSRTDEVKVYVLSDVHIGSALCDEKKFLAVVERIANEGAYWIGLGDMADAIGREDIRHKESLLAPWLHGENAVFRLQRRTLAKYLQPIADKCLMYLLGNHEEYTERRIGVDMYYSVAEEAGIAPECLVGMSGYLQLTLRRKSGGARTAVIYAHHGWGGGNYLGGMALKLERMPGQHHGADVYLMGHTHRLFTCVDAYDYCDKGGNVRVGYMHYANCGTFAHTTKKSDATYTERLGKTQSPIGYVQIVLRADTGRTTDVIANAL